MSYKLYLPALWRHGRGHYHAGTYRVPREMPEDLAERAIKQAGAFKLSAEAAPEKAKPRRKARPAAPGNKMQAGAPENKSTGGEGFNTGSIERAAKPEPSEAGDSTET